MLKQVQHDGVFVVNAGLMDRQPCVYILASQQRGTLYIGLTSNLAQRLYQHRNDLLPGFTSKHHVHRLVWAESHDSMGTAIAREKQLKRWRRPWKINLIKDANPDWRDLAVDWGLAPPLGRRA
jgi:putative endonuclease